MTQAPLMDRIHITEDYDVPRVINGGWQLSAGHALERPLDLADASRAFNRLIDMGFDTFDCADIYTGVEDFFGGIIRERRKAGLRLPQIHTKFVPDLNDLANVTPAYVENIITRSLRRLGVERLDAVQFHWWDYSVPGMVDVAGELVRLQEKGLIRLISTTNFNAVELRKLIDAGIPVATNQCQYSVLDRRPAMRLERLCRETGVKLLCYGTIAGGFMSEQWLDAPKPDHFENRSLVKYALVIEDSLRWEGFQALLALMKEIGDPLGLSIANVSTLWTLSRPEVAAAIIGTRSSRHVDGNAALIGRPLPPEAVAVLGHTKSERITTMITDLVAHSGNGKINFSPEVEAAYAVLKDFMYSTVYVDKEAKREEKKVDKLVAELYERLCEEPTLMPNFYLQIAYNEGVDRAVTDYISGMSDEFATRLFEDLFVPQKWTVL